jgi:hypothetical protein
MIIFHYYDYYIVYYYYYCCYYWFNYDYILVALPSDKTKFVVQLHYNKTQHNNNNNNNNNNICNVTLYIDRYTILIITTFPRGVVSPSSVKHKVREDCRFRYT